MGPSELEDIVQIPGHFPVRVDRSRDSLLTDFGKATLNNRYLLPGESYQDLFGRVASYYGADAGHAQRIYDYISRHWFMPATPVLSNGGTDRGLPISCFLNEAQDSLEGIVDLWNENVWLASKGGGIGSYYGNLRSIGEDVGSVGKTSGVIPFIRVTDSLTLAVSQGALRRGSAAVYLPVWHPEVEEFVEMRKPQGGDPNRKALNLHHGVLVSDAFMKAVEVDEEWALVSPADGSTIRKISARGLWIRILEARMAQGEPYVIYEDTVRRHRPEIYKQLNHEVKTSNLCVHGDTRILTQAGYRPIKDLAGSDQFLWNGHEWSLSRVEQTSANARMRRVEFSNDATLWVTDDHKFYVQDSYHTRPREVRAADLKVGDKLEKWELPVVEEDSSLSPPYEYDVTVASNGADFVEGPTFCANEPLRHKIVLEGVQTGNCAEITLTTGPDFQGKDRTAVCCLSSLNLEYWSEWRKDPQFIEDVMLFLDNVLQDFIDKAPDSMEKARYAAMRERSVGLGVMGFHSLLQSRMIPFESYAAKDLNRRIFRHIRRRADWASIAIGKQRGPCPDAAHLGLPDRFTHKMAIAPTASISIIAGNASPGIEPISANVFLQKTLSGSFSVRNRHLKKILAEKGKDTDEVWSAITLNKGSVQNLDFLTADEKSVFKTAFELDQIWIIDMAADRAPDVDQAQSVNLFVLADVPKKVLHWLHHQAWKKGLKSLYYCRSLSLQRADTVSNVLVGVAADNVAPVTNASNGETCEACQ